MQDLIVRTGPKYKVSELFFSFQGEGTFTGVPTLWLRSFGCNLECNGFGQTDPCDPSTWVLPSASFDVDTVNAVEDLPVWDKGCDSSYSWSRKYRHLIREMSAVEIVDAWQEMIKSPTNPKGLMTHPVTKQTYHICFTGGEPMMNQGMIIDVLSEVRRRFYEQIVVTIETNGTRPVKPEFKAFVNETHIVGDFCWFMSISPKLFSVSGEPNDRAIKPEQIAQYLNLPLYDAQIKYVVNSNAWYELTHVHQQIQTACANVVSPYTSWVMPVGATTEAQDQVAADIAIEAMKQGFNVAARVHCYVFGNKIGF